MPIEVELVYDSDCPNVEATRGRLQRALQEAGLPGASWREWNRASVESPVYVRTHGSPTILVNGQDVASAPSADQGDCCRIYAEEDGQLVGVPPTEAIISALRKARAREKTISQGWLNSLAALPATGVALLPGLTCPACWPAYGALLGSLGLGFVNYTPYLLSSEHSLHGSCPRIARISGTRSPRLRARPTRLSCRFPGGSRKVSTLLHGRSVCRRNVVGGRVPLESVATTNQ